MPRREPMAGTREWIADSLLRTPAATILLMSVLVYAGVLLFRPPDGPKQPPIDHRPPSPPPAPSFVVSDKAFEPNGFDLTPEAKGDIARWARARPKDAQMLFLGYADRRRSSMGNDLLSARRAEAARAAFDGDAGQGDRALGLGSRFAASCGRDDEACLKGDRRVELWSRTLSPAAR